MRWRGPSNGDALSRSHPARSRGTARGLRVFLSPSGVIRSPNFFGAEGLNCEKSSASLRIPLRLGLSQCLESGVEWETKIFASKHLTNEPTWFILQGCQRIGTDFVKAAGRLASELIENRS